MGYWLVKAAWWGAKWVVKSYLWAIAHPVAAIVVGAVLAGTGAWLAGQKWAGSEVLGRMMGWIGVGLLTTGMGAWIGAQIAAGLPLVGQAAGRFVGGGIGAWTRSPSFSAFGWSP